MAWTYTDWVSQTTDALRLSQLNLHIAEVSASVEGRADSVSADGKTMTKPQLLQYLDMLLNQRDALRESPGQMTAGGRTLVRWKRAT